MHKLNVSAAPHIHSGASVTRVMLDVVIALVPAAIASVVLFGLQALVLLATCIATCVVSEFLFNAITKKTQTIGDLSAVVTGLILGLNLSINVPVWQAVVGSVFAIIVVKCFFGGIGHNVVNPAVAARVMMLLAFTSTVAGGALPKPELTAGPTPLTLFGQEGAPSLTTLLLGTHGGCIGETSAIALLIGFVYLVARKVIRWQIPVVFTATVFVCYIAATGDVMAATYQILAGGLLLGAIFMATDYVTTPITTWGRVLFALGCGLITFAIRFWGSYPEGVSIAILCMNLLTPFLEKWTKKTPLGG